MNKKKIANVALDKNDYNSVSTVGMVKEITPFTKYSFYREFFEEFYDFGEVRDYRVTQGVFGTTFSGLKPNLSFTVKDLQKIQEGGLIVDNYNLTLATPNSPDFSMCIVMDHYTARGFEIKTTVSVNSDQTKISYDGSTTVTLKNNKGTVTQSILSSFNGKKIVLWISEKGTSDGATKVSISNYSGRLIHSIRQIISQRRGFVIKAVNSTFYRLMYSTNFYDLDSEVYHKVMLQEKLNGSYVL